MDNPLLVEQLPCFSAVDDEAIAHAEGLLLSLPVLLAVGGRDVAMNRLRLKRSQTIHRGTTGVLGLIVSILSQANHDKTSCSPFLRSRSCRLLSGGRPRTICFQQLPCESRRPGKGAPRAHPCIQPLFVNVSRCGSVDYYIRCGMMLFHATSAESTCTSISLLTAGNRQDQTISNLLAICWQKKRSHGLWVRLYL